MKQPSKVEFPEGYYHEDDQPMIEQAILRVFHERGGATVLQRNERTGTLEFVEHPVPHIRPKRRRWWWFR